MSRDPRAERELDDELRSYLSLLIDEKIASGLDPAAARRAALIELDGVEQVKERVRVHPAGWRRPAPGELPADPGDRSRLQERRRAHGLGQPAALALRGR